MPGDWSTGGRDATPDSSSLSALPPFDVVSLETAGHVGAPLPCSMVKLVDIPEMNYYAKNGEGEVSESPDAASLQSCPLC